MHKLKRLCVATALITLAGCSTNPLTGESQIDRTTVGAVVGTVAGGLIGAAIGDGRVALIGAAIGASVGGGTGYLLDRRHAELQRKLQGTGLTVEKVAGPTQVTQALVVKAPSDVMFKTGSADLQNNAFSGLARLADALRDHPDQRAVITGHTDNVGARQSNVKLSYNRARSVAQYLYANGIQPNRIEIRGAADSQPIADNDSEVGRQANRRVEIRISI
ncbi:TPA: OmpA family protein [Pseudomonas aeruginosa]